MKKCFTVGILVIMVMLTLAGCSRYDYEETQVQATVTSCRAGKFRLNETDLALANKCEEQGNRIMYNKYMDLAKANGSYEYRVTVDIDGKDCIVVREEPYNVGDEIIVTKVKVYKKSFLNSSLVRKEYQ